MYLVRDIMHCKPGKVREMLGKFKSMSGLMAKTGAKPPKLYTDVSGERFWTIIAEFEVESMDGFMTDMEKEMSNPEAQKIMTGYHDLVKEGRREIYKVEG
jgi:hypothetical protein